MNSIITKLLYKFETRIGPFYMGEIHGRHQPIYEGESLGSYAHAWQAAEDLLGGHTFSISSGIDTSSLGIRVELEEWKKIHS